MSEDIFTLTGSPYYNEVITNIKQVCLDDFSFPSVTELKGSLQFMSEFNKKFQELYKKQKLIQVAHPVIEKENITIEKNFILLDEILLKITREVKAKNKEALKEHMIQGKEIISSLFKSFDEINRVEEEGHKYSNNPVLNEIIRISEGVLENRFPLEPLQNIVDDFCKKVMTAYEEFLILKKVCRDDMKEDISKIEFSYKGLMEGINEIKKFFHNKEKSLLKHGMETVREHSENLMEFQKILEKTEEEPSTKSCLRCGAINSREAKFCIKCKMVIPEFKSKLADSSLDIKLQSDEVVSGQGTVMTKNLYRLSKAVEDFQSGRGTKENLIAIVEWLEKKIITSKKQFENQKKKKPANIPWKDKSFIEEMEKLIEKGISEFEGTIKDFKVFFNTGEDVLLKIALEKAVDAGDKLYKVQMMFQSHQNSNK